MNLVDLVLTVCLATSGNDCHTEHLYFEHNGSLMQCMLRAPAHIARWSEDHPGFKVVRWKCTYPDRGRQI
ncbi:MAG TPA: hypothetical protein VFT89_10155 [Rhizobiaceae bacterium]|nr:hypothetical protein [Rhizobiaceae bacterium]